MSEKKWDDSEIEKLLQQVPDIKDNRSKEDILLRLQSDDRLKMNSNNINKKVVKWLPAFVAVAALFILSIIVIPVFQNEEQEMAVTEKAKLDTANMDMNKDRSISNETNRATSVEDDNLSHYAIYPSDLTNETLWHIGLVGDAGMSVPVTFLIPEAHIKHDFGNRKPTTVDLYNIYANRLDEEALGFVDYHPYRGTFSTNGQTIIQQLLPNHAYDRSSSSLDTFKQSILDTFYDFDEVLFENNKQQRIEFNQVGKPSQPLKLTNGKNQQGYYKFKQSNSDEYLASNFGEKFETLAIALEKMKETPNDVYTTVIPEGVDFEVLPSKEYTTIQFTHSLDLESLNGAEAMQLIEGILLTAASFNTQIKFENTVQTEWNGFDFTSKLPIPIGANPLPFILR